MNPDPAHPLLVVMGVSGSGKSTIGAALARRLGVPFGDADDMHPETNVAKMSAGHPLDDADRLPWLTGVGAWLAGQPQGAVVACSALKRSYRDLLRHCAPGVRFVHLDGGRDTIARRQADRPGHFMPATLLGTQFAALEPLAPEEDGVVVDVGQPVDRVVEQAVVLLVPAPDRPQGAETGD